MAQIPLDVYTAVQACLLFRRFSLSRAHHRDIKRCSAGIYLPVYFVRCSPKSGDLYERNAPRPRRETINKFQSPRAGEK